MTPESLGMNVIVTLLTIGCPNINIVVSVRLLISVRTLAVWPSLNVILKSTLIGSLQGKKVKIVVSTNIGAGSLTQVTVVQSWFLVQFPTETSLRPAISLSSEAQVSLDCC